MKIILHKFILLPLFILMIVSAYGQNEEEGIADSLVVLLQNNKQTDLKRVSALANVVNVYFKNRDFQKAKPFINEIIELAEELNNNYVKALGDYYKGSVLLIDNKNKDALEYLLRAEHLTSILRKSEENLRLQIRIYSSLSVYYFKSQMFKEYYENIQKGLDLNKELQHADLDFSLKSNLAVVYLQLGKDSAAIEIDKKLISEEKYADQNLFYPYFHLGEFYLNLNHYDTALLYFSKAYQYVSIPEDAAWVFFKKGTIFNIKQKYKEAHQILRRCLDTLPSSTSSETVANAYIELGYSYFMQSKTDSALILIEKGIKRAHMHHYLDVEVDGYYRKTQILYESGRFEEFSHQILKYIQLKDSLNIVNNIHQLSELVFQQKIKEEEEEIRYKQYILETKQKQQLLVFIFVSVFLISAIIVVLLLLNRKNILLQTKKMQEESLSKELDLRNRELAAKVLTQVQKKELLSGIIEKLRDIELKKVPPRNIKNIINDLQQSLGDHSPEDFDYYFVQTHPDFYDNLRADFPNLTPYELRLCAYLKMNLSTKDIAAINNISPDSARTARSRLRKTLNIKNQDENLVHFISKY